MSKQEIRKLINESILESIDNEIDSIALAKSNALSKYDAVKDAREYAGEDWKNLSPQEREEIIIDLERGFESSLNENLELTKEELAHKIKEGVKKEHRKNLIESRIEQINKELNILSNPESWEDSKKDAQNQLRKKNIAWDSMIPREKLINEGLSEKGKLKIQDWIEEYGHRMAGKKMIDVVIKRQLGLTSEDLSDTTTFANGLDNIEGLLSSGEIDLAFEAAKETADEMLEDEMGGLFENRK